MYILYLCIIQDGNTALHIAAKLGNVHTVKALLSAGAHPAILNEVSELCIINIVYFVCMLLSGEGIICKLISYMFQSPTHILDQILPQWPQDNL